MNLTYKKPSYDYMINSMLDIMEDGVGEFFTEPIYHFYSNIIKDKVETLNTDERKQYIFDSLKETYNENEKLFEKKIIEYQNHWGNNREIITNTFEDIFQMDLKNKFNNMIGQINLNPICPRYLDTNTFDVFYLNSEKGALGITLHEIVHFIWFSKWNEKFNDSPKEYEQPNLKWIFSEIVVDPILLDKRIKNLNPYENPVYNYFYDIQVRGKNFIELIRGLYNDNDINSFMDKGYALCLEYEKEIRVAMY